MSEPIVVIGGGIVGTSIALHAADRGSSTVLVERDAAPQGASSSSFASITALDERSQDLYLLKAASLPAWHRWDKRLNGDAGLRWDGEIRWTQTRDGARELINKIGNARARGYPVRLISPSQLAILLPAARPEPVEAASFAPEDGHVEPQRVIAAARRALQEAGSRLVHGRGKIIIRETGVEVQVAEETIKASTIVLATGAETASLTDKLGWDIPLAPSPGLLLTTTPAAPIAPHTVYVTPASGPPIHLRQLADGRVLIGERSQDFATENPTQGHASSLLRQAARYFPALREVEIDHFNVEWRPMPGDRMPVIGPAPGLPALYIAVMHSGVTLAPSVGDLVAFELVERRVAPLLEPFRPARFAERSAQVTLDLEDIFRQPSQLYLG